MASAVKKTETEWGCVCSLEKVTENTSKKEIFEQQMKDWSELAMQGHRVKEQELIWLIQDTTRKLL